MELVKDLLMVVGRISTIYPLLLIVALFMGRRSLAELPVFDFIVILSIGAVVGADIADPKIEHIHTAFAIIAIGLLQRLVSILMIRIRRFGKWITFEPVIVIKDGIFLIQNLKKVHYSIDNILQMLRENQVFDISSVDIAVLEANGRLTVHKKADKAAVTLEHLGIKPLNSGLSYPVIKEGLIQTKTLSELKLTKD